MANKEDENGALEAIRNNFLHDAYRGVEPTCIAEVCPPGKHVLERRVEVPCGAMRSMNGWFSEHTCCDELRTDRCKLCPYWCCANHACRGEAWDDSVGLAHAWNNEAGLTGSQTLYRPPQGMAYGSIYNNHEEPWGMTEGWGITRGGDGIVGSYWRAHVGHGEMFDAAQYQSGGSRGMRQWWSGWGGQQDRSSSGARCDP